MKNEEGKADFREMMDSIRTRAKNLPVKSPEDEKQELEKFRYSRWNGFYSRLKNLPPDCSDIRIDELDFNTSPALKHLKVWELEDHFGFVFHGPVGSGKTHALIAMMNKVVIKVIEELEDDPLSYVDFWPVSKYIDSLKREMNGSDSEKKTAQRAMGVPFLFIDDLGAENMTEWAGEQIMSLLDHRVKFHKATFITTNGSLKSISESLGDRTSSRLKELGVFIEVVGKDRRNEVYMQNLESLKRRHEST